METSKASQLLADSWGGRPAALPGWEESTEKVRTLAVAALQVRKLRSGW